MIFAASATPTTEGMTSLIRSTSSPVTVSELGEAGGPARPRHLDIGGHVKTWANHRPPASHIRARAGSSCRHGRMLALYDAVRRVAYQPQQGRM